MEQVKHYPLRREFNGNIDKLSTSLEELEALCPVALTPNTKTPPLTVTWRGYSISLMRGREGGLRGNEAAIRALSLEHNILFRKPSNYLAIHDVAHIQSEEATLRHSSRIDPLLTQTFRVLQQAFSAAPISDYESDSSKNITIDGLSIRCGWFRIWSFRHFCVHEDSLGALQELQARVRQQTRPPGASVGDNVNSQRIRH